MVKFFQKMKETTKSPPMASLREILFSWAGGIVGISTVFFLNNYCVAQTDHLFVIAFFGALAVLIFSAIKNSLAQPRNLVGGNIISALAGVTRLKLLFLCIWLAAGVTAWTAIAAMYATETLHTLGGAALLIAVIGGAKIHAMGYFHVLIPAGSVALSFNNIPKARKYPEYWIQRGQAEVSLFFRWFRRVSYLCGQFTDNCVPGVALQSGLCGVKFPLAFSNSGAA